MIPMPRIAFSSNGLAWSVGGTARVADTYPADLSDPEFPPQSRRGGGSGGFGAVPQARLQIAGWTAQTNAPGTTSGRVPGA